MACHFACQRRALVDLGSVDRYVGVPTVAAVGDWRPVGSDSDDEPIVCYVAETVVQKRRCWPTKAHWL